MSTKNIGVEIPYWRGPLVEGLGLRWENVDCGDTGSISPAILCGGLEHLSVSLQRIGGTSATPPGAWDANVHIDVYGSIDLETFRLWYNGLVDADGLTTGIDIAGLRAVRLQVIDVVSAHVARISAMATGQRSRGFDVASEEIDLEASVYGQAMSLNGARLLSVQVERTDDPPTAWPGSAEIQIYGSIDRQEWHPIASGLPLANDITTGIATRGVAFVRPQVVTQASMRAKVTMAALSIP